MLTLPDIKAKQILFIQTERGAKNRLFFKNENIVFEKDGEIINQSSCHRIIAVFIIGDYTITSGLIKECRKRAVTLFLISDNFKIYGSINSKAEGNYLLRMAQYAAKPEMELEIAKKIVANKISNQIILLKTTVDSGKGIDGDNITCLIDKAKTTEELLGIEGSFGKVYFNRYFKDIGWYRRMPRVKPDVPNFLLDLGYTFLFNFIDAILQLFGFDTYKGYYHKLFFQRKSLACDIMEPFRCLIDKQTKKSFHLSQINLKDFTVENGRYCLTYDKSQKYAKIYLEAIMENRGQIYLYARKFYRYVMDNKHNRFPEFSVKTNTVD